MAYNKEDEKNMILEYQRTQNPMLLRKLRRTFAGTINHAIQISNTSGLDQRSLDQKALLAFQNAISSYNPSKGAPNTHITNTIQGYLRNQNTQWQNTTRLSGEDTTLQNQLFVAKAKLEANGIDVEKDREALVKEVQSMRTSKKKITDDWLKKVEDSTKKSFSGDRLIGDTGVGEDITFMDVLNGTSTNAEEEYEKKLTVDKFKQAFDSLNPQEQRIFAERNPGVFGINEGKKQLSWNYIALNNNIGSGYLAEKKYKEIEGKLRDHVNK